MAVWAHLMSIAGLPNWNTSHCDRLCEIGKHRVVIQTDRCSVISWRGLWFTPFTTPANKLLKANGSINNTAQEQHNNLSRQFKTCCCSQRRCPWNSSGAGLVLHAKSVTWQWAHFAFSHWVTLTLCVIVVLGGLHSFADLHANDVNFGLAVLQHLQSRLEHLLILREGETMKRKWPERREEVMVGPSLACFMQSRSTLAWRQEL